MMKTNVHKVLVTSYNNAYIPQEGIQIGFASPSERSVPSAVQQEGELVDFKEVAVRGASVYALRQSS